MNIFGGSEAKKAQDLTAEIDRATDAAVLDERVSDERALGERARQEAAKTETHELKTAERAGWQPGEVSAETRSLGSAALEQAVIASNEAIKEQVATENGYVDNGIEVGRNVIGGESERQIKERMADDLEDAKMETGVDLPPELQGQAALLTKNQESLTDGAIKAIDRIVREQSARPAEMERTAALMRAKMLATLGRKLGERN